MECADDAAAQAARRKAQMDERMAARAAEVEHQREVRKDGEDRSTRELVLAFESAFADGLARATGALGDALDVAALGDVSAAVQSLHQDVAAASTFLPAQTLERTTRSLAELEASARVKREQVAPKKRFAFKARDKLAPALPPAPGPGGAGAPAGARGTSVAANVAEPPLAPPAPPPARVPGHDGAEVRCRRGERLALAPPRGSGGDMALSELVDCDVTLLDGVAALWVDKLVRCRVVSLPIAGAVHINRCEGCEFHFASRQIRVHTTTSTDFYLHAGSHPIIEVWRHRHDASPAGPPSATPLSKRHPLSGRTLSVRRARSPGVHRFALRALLANGARVRRGVRCGRALQKRQPVELCRRLPLAAHAAVAKLASAARG